MSKYRVWTSPLTNNIYAGSVSKNGLIAKVKHNVTDDAVRSVAEHLLIADQKLLFDFKGKKYELKVVEVKQEITTFKRH